MRGSCDAAGCAQVGRHRPVAGRRARRSTPRATRPTFGGRGLDYRGAVGTGTPAYIEIPSTPSAPGFPAAVARHDRRLPLLHPREPARGLPGARDRRRPHRRRAASTSGWRRRTAARVRAGRSRASLRRLLHGRSSTLPDFTATVKRYLAMPETGLRQALLHGPRPPDADVPYALTMPYVDKLQGQPPAADLQDLRRRPQRHAARSRSATRTRSSARCSRTGGAEAFAARRRGGATGRASCAEVIR